MTKKPVAPSADVVTYLTEQHDAIRALFIETLNASNTKTQQDSFIRLRTLLAVHETAEEVMVHTRVRRKIAGGADIVDARLAEEHDTKIALGELEKIPCGTTEFSKKLTDLQANVMAHAEREEKEEFVLLAQHLDGEELARLTSAVQLAERIAPPTHPRAGVESGFVNFAAGPSTSILDRARDLLRGRST